MNLAPSIDQHILKTFCISVDGFNFSSYFYKSRNGRLTFGPVWDHDRSLSSNNDSRDDNPRVWRPTTAEIFDFFNYSWWGRMFQNTNFWQMWVDRYQELRETTFSQTNLRITEIMYHPAAESGDTNDAERLEFIEERNVGTTPLDLNGFRFTAGIDFEFPEMTLDPGRSGVIARDPTRYQFPNSPLLIGVFTNQLSNDGERLRLEGPVGEPIHDFISDGSSNRRLTKLGKVCTPSAWSPGGRWISFRYTDERYWSNKERVLKVYAEKPADKRPVWVIRPDGSDARVLGRCASNAPSTAAALHGNLNRDELPKRTFQLI